MANYATTYYGGNLPTSKLRAAVQVDVWDVGCDGNKRKLDWYARRGMYRNAATWTGRTSSSYGGHIWVNVAGQEVFSQDRTYNWNTTWTGWNYTWPEGNIGQGTVTVAANTTHNFSIRWKDNWGWDITASASIAVGDCCVTTGPTGLKGWTSNVQAFQITNNASITGWGTECTTNETRSQETTISTRSKRDDSYSGQSIIYPSSTSTTMAYTHTNLTPNTRYYFDSAFRNKTGWWTQLRAADQTFSYNAITSLESPSVRITGLDSRSVNFNWSQNMGGKASNGNIYYRITATGSSASVKGSDTTCGSFTTSTSGTAVSGSRNSWTDGFRLNPNTKYDLWVWSNNVRNSVITKVTFVTDRISSTIYEGIEDKVHSSVTVKTRRQNARYFDRGTSEITTNVGTGQVYLTTATNPDTAPGSFGKRVTYGTGTWNCRYIRLQMGPNTVNTGRHIFKWQVINTAGTDVAQGRTSISGWTNSTVATNTSWNSASYSETTGNAWLTLDLGSNQTIRETIVYPYYYPNESNTKTTTASKNASIRGYQFLNIEISTNNSNWTRVYSSGNTYGIQTQATTKGDGTNPGNNQAAGNLLGYRVVPDSPTLRTTISNLNKSTLAVSNNQRITPGKTYKIMSTTTDRHYATGWSNHASIEFPVARRIKSDGSIIDYRLWRIRPNGQKFKMTGSIIDRSQD